MEEEWRQIFLFGMFGKKKTVDYWLINYVAVVLRRNYAHFEGRKVKIKELFKAIVRRDVEMNCKYGGNEVKEFFINGNKFIKEGERKEILVNF